MRARTKPPFAILKTAGFRVALVLALCLQSGNGRASAAPCRGPAYGGEVYAAVRDVASVWPLPGSLVQAVILRESAFNPWAVSSAGAIGLMQVLPSNARRLGVTPEALWNPASNILAGTRLLAVLLRHYRGDVISALVAYNARPRRLFAPLPANAETPKYVRAVLHAWSSFARCARRSLLPTASRHGERSESGLF